MKEILMALLIIVCSLACTKYINSEESLKKEIFKERQKKIEEELIQNNLSNCYIKTTEIEKKILFFYFLDETYGGGIGGKFRERNITIYDTLDRFFKTSFLKNLDKIESVDGCYAIFADKNDFKYMQYNFMPKHFYILIKKPRELAGKIKKVNLIRNGTNLNINIDKFVKNFKDPDPEYDPFPEVKWHKFFED